MAPHSSDSTWPKLIHRSRSTGMISATAADTSGNMPPGAGVEEQRLVGVDEELVEGRSPSGPTSGT